MEELLRHLLNRLDSIGKEHDELYDSECREQMGNAVMSGFVRALDRYDLPAEFGLYSAEANRMVRSALMEYVNLANAKASDVGMSGFHDRLAAFQNPEIESDIERNYYDDFFGYAAPKAFDASGRVI